MEWIPSLTRSERITIGTYEDPLFVQAWKEQHSNPRYQSGQLRKWFDAFRERLPEGRIIDIGCGPGLATRLFVDAGYEYVGMDRSGIMISEAIKDNPQAKFFQADFYAIGSRGDAFDGFWASTSFLHARKGRVHYVLQEVHRVVRPGGIGFVSMRTKLHLHHNIELIESVSYAPGKRRLMVYYELHGFANILESNGFEVVHERKDWSLYNDKPGEDDIYLCYFVRRL